jgi:hypothetical protein
VRFCREQAIRWLGLLGRIDLDWASARSVATANTIANLKFEISDHGNGKDDGKCRSLTLRGGFGMTTEG